MPPKPKFTRDQMITAAMNLIEEKGYESLTARELGKYLGSSSCPIFTLFKDMDELKTEVKNRAVEIFNEYMAVAEEFYPAYKKRGMQWVKFASEQPRLFRLLFMQETSGQADFDAAQKIIPFGKQNDIDIIMRDYNANREQAERLSGRCGFTLTGFVRSSHRRCASFRKRKSPEISAKFSTE